MTPVDLADHGVFVAERRAACGSKLHAHCLPSDTGPLVVLEDRDVVLERPEHEVVEAATCEHVVGGAERETANSASKN